MKKSFFGDFKNRVNQLSRAINKKHVITAALYMFVFCCVFYLSSKFLIHDEYIAKLTVLTLHIPENGQSSYSSLAASHVLSDSFSNSYMSNELLQYTINKLDLDYDEAALLKKISVYRKPKTLIINIYVRDRNKENAILICNTFAEGMKEELASFLYINKIIQVEEVEANLNASNKIVYALLGAFVGFVIYIAVFYMQYYYAKRIWSIELVRKLNVVYLGTAYIDVVQKGGISF